MKKFLSFSIITAVTLFVFGYSGFIFLSSITDQHSNLQLAGRLGRQAVVSINNQLSENVQANFITTSPIPSVILTPTPILLNSHDCVSTSNSSFISTNSITDYLVFTNRPSSFSDRTLLAANYEIVEYRGTSDQNLTLLAAVIQYDSLYACK